MAGAGVGRDQERRPADAGLGQSDAERLIGQADDAAMRGGRDDLPRGVALAGPQRTRTRHSGLRRPVAAPARRSAPSASSWPGRRRRRCSGRPRGSPPIKPQRGQGPIGGGLVGRRRGQLEPERVDRAAEVARQLQVGFHDRGRQPPPVRVARVVQDGRSARSPPMSLVADPSRDAGQPGHPAPSGTSWARAPPGRTARAAAGADDRDRALPGSCDRWSKRSSRRTRRCRRASAPPAA